MPEARYLLPDQIRVVRPGGSIRPRLEVVGEFTILAAQLKRIFPLSKAREYISVLDGAGKEMGILRTMDGLDKESTRIVEEELDRRYFTPVIESIQHLKQEAGMWHFVVGTQRGPTEFYVRNWRDSAHEISANRWQINSVDGGRFDIPNLEALDANSRKLMYQLL